MERRKCLFPWIFTLRRLAGAEGRRDALRRTDPAGDLADGFVALPRGFGTADELFEILTWAQLGLHSQPVGLLNISGFIDPLLAWARRDVQLSR
ncbi:MAG TPA: LOG family protein [Gemmataceae bacterium]|nr:LOG family protein [Gemmataceae bacterium]